MSAACLVLWIVHVSLLTLKSLCLFRFPPFCMTTCCFQGFVTQAVFQSHQDADRIQSCCFGSVRLGPAAGLVLEHSEYFLPVCPVLGAFYLWAVVLRHKQDKEATFSAVGVANTVIVWVRVAEGQLKEGATNSTWFGMLFTISFAIEEISGCQ